MGDIGFAAIGCEPAELAAVAGGYRFEQSGTPCMNVKHNILFRVGEGHDTHRTIADRPLIIGGVHITDSEFGLDGHSDADVLIHAIIDAMLGASGQGDIGEWFPNTSDEWKGADSAKLLLAVAESISDRRWRIVNLDCTIHAERPRMGKWKPLIRTRLAELLNVAPDIVNVKAKSGERVGPVGRGESISADAIILLHYSAESHDESL